jgi:SAM-dependent methyltransferase
MSGSEQNIMGADVDGFIFSRSVYLQVILQMVLKELGELRGRRCLVVGSPNAFMSRQLRLAGGEWSEMTFAEEQATLLREVIGDNERIRLFKRDERIPFDEKSFDIIVILGGFDGTNYDYDFIEQCHKMLDSGGMLLTCVPREKKVSLIGALRSLCGVNAPVYSERRIFDVLKNGFDVLHVRSFARFFSETVNVIVTGRTLKKQTPLELMRLYKIAYPLYWIAYQLDLLLFFSKGHRLIAQAKRHAWRSRDAPVLSDGRTISEAVLKPLTD